MGLLFRYTILSINKIHPYTVSKIKKIQICHEIISITDIL